jgi:hypothetical protein
MCVHIMPVQAIQPTKKVADPLRALKETAQAMANNGATPPELPPGEAELRQEREDMEGRSVALTAATRAVCGQGGGGGGGRLVSGLSRMIEAVACVCTVRTWMARLFGLSAACKQV